MPLYVVKIKYLEALAEASEGDDRGSFGAWTDLHGAVVVAANGTEARKLVSLESDEKGRDWWWDSAEHVSCEEIVDDGKPRVILGDWPTG